jgi:SAM-dependent methyltransferase
VHVIIIRQCGGNFITKKDFETHVKKHKHGKKFTQKLFYEFLYRYSKAPWDTGPRSELVEFVNKHIIEPNRALDLGCGTGSNAIFLAQQGFDVTGVDFASSAIVRAREKAKETGAKVNFVLDDITSLHHVKGIFDLLVDYGTFDDLSQKNRQKYVETVLSLSHSRTQYFLWTFEWKLLWWERFLFRLFPFAAITLEPGEVNKYFGKHFDIERVCGATDLKGWPRGYSCYLMTRKEAGI